VEAKRDGHELKILYAACAELSWVPKPAASAAREVSEGGGTAILFNLSFEGTVS
jgi:hypothetical protein